MVSNSPWVPFKGIKRAHYRDFPEDLRPSHIAQSAWPTSAARSWRSWRRWCCCSPPTRSVTIVAAVLHGLLPRCSSSRRSRWRCRWSGTCCSPVRAVFLFLGYPELGRATASATCPRRGCSPRSSPAWCSSRCWATCAPTWCPSCPSMRQYAGNWASATWAFAPGARGEAERAHSSRPRQKQVDQLPTTCGTSRGRRRSSMQQMIGWRSMHSQGRGLFSVLINHLGDDIDTDAIREAEFACNSLDRLQLRRRPPARREADRGGPATLPASRRANSSSRGSSRSPSTRDNQQLQGDRRRPRRDRARYLEGRRRGRRAAVAARTDRSRTQVTWTACPATSARHGAAGRGAGRSAAWMPA